MPEPIIDPSHQLEPHKSWFSKHMLYGYLFIFAVLVLIVCGVLYYLSSRSMPNVSPVVHKDPTADWKRYTNTEYGFELSLTDTFSRYSVSGSPLNDHTELSFYLNSGYQPFDIVVIPLNNWKDETIGEFLNKNDKYVFVGIRHPDCPSKDGMQDSVLCHKLYEDITQIFSSFKFTDLNTVCIQVITPAKNLVTGEVKDFPTPCDVPEGWQKL